MIERLPERGPYTLQGNVPEMPFVLSAVGNGTELGHGYREAGRVDPAVARGQDR